MRSVVTAAVADIEDKRLVSLLALGMHMGSAFVTPVDTISWSRHHYLAVNLPGTLVHFERHPGLLLRGYLDCDHPNLGCGVMEVVENLTWAERDMSQDEHSLMLTWSNSDREKTSPSLICRGVDLENSKDPESMARIA